MSYTTIRYQEADGIGTISFARPEVHNAFNSTVIDELRALFADLETRPDLRVVVLTGEGKSFCAGADLNWMRAVVTQSYDENLAEATALAELFYEMYTFPRPIVGRINGAAIGGGTGFVSLCDIAIAAKSATFSFSEVKIGVVPACIGPYVIRKIGEGKARELFITGERMNAERAHSVSLVNTVVEDAELDARVKALVDAILSSGPEAVATAKELVSNMPQMSPDEFIPYTAEMIARLRISPEGQEGMSAFLEKRKPSWVKPAPKD